MPKDGKPKIAIKPGFTIKTDVAGVANVFGVPKESIATERPKPNIPIKGEPIRFTPLTHIRVDGKRIQLPDGFSFFYDLDGIWVICTTGKMEERLGKKIGLIDMLVEADVQLSKTQLWFIDQQARLLEARAHTYRIVARAKSNNGHRKES